MALSEEDARTKLVALQAEMDESAELYSELEAALEEDKKMLELDLEASEKSVQQLQHKVQRMEEERTQLITQRDQSSKQILQLQDKLQLQSNAKSSGNATVRSLEQTNATLES